MSYNSKAKNIPEATANEVCVEEVEELASEIDIEEVVIRDDIKVLVS